MTALLLASVVEEIRPTIERLGLQPQDADHVGTAAGQPVVLSVCGIGAARVTAALERLVAAHQPARLIHLGFAGGLDPQLTPGQLLEVKQVIDGQGGAYRLDGGVPQPIQPDPAAGPVLLTLDHIADTVEKKRELAARHGAAIVDMESFHVARWCHARGLPMLELRAVSDPADMALPAESLRWVRPDGTVDINAATAYVMVRPWLVPSLMALQRHGRAAAAALAEEVARRLTGA